MGPLKTDDRSLEAVLKEQPPQNIHLLLDAIENINHSTELNSLLSESMEAARIMMNAEASSLMLVDEDTGELYLSVPTGPVKNEIRDTRIPRHRGIGGWVVENKKPFMTNNPEESEIFWGDISPDFKTRNIICVPLINRKNEAIGVLQAVNRRRNEPFTAHDIPVFQALSSHITAAIERARQMDRLNSQLQEKEVMLTEIHHRIKNNIAAICGLIEIEMDDVRDEQARNILRATFSRLQSMAQVHDLLCRDGLFQEIDLAVYLEKLIENTESAMWGPESAIQISFDTESIKASPAKALICGLIVNELLVNICKHAFRSAEVGNIRISLKKTGGKAQLEIRDDGIGLPDDFQTREVGSTGMRIVEVMVKKLEGTLSIRGDEGADFLIEFPF